MRRIAVWAANHRRLTDIMHEIDDIMDTDIYNINATFYLMDACLPSRRYSGNHNCFDETFIDSSMLHLHGPNLDDIYDMIVGSMANGSTAHYIDNADDIIRICEQLGICWYKEEVISEIIVSSDEIFALIMEENINV